MVSEGGKELQELIMSASLRLPPLSVIPPHALRGSGPTWHDTVHVSSLPLRGLYWPATQKAISCSPHTQILELKLTLSDGQIIQARVPSRPQPGNRVSPPPPPPR